MNLYQNLDTYSQNVIYITKITIYLWIINTCCIFLFNNNGVNLYSPIILIWFIFLLRLTYRNRKLKSLEENAKDLFDKDSLNKRDNFNFWKIKENLYWMFTPSYVEEECVKKTIYILFALSIFVFLFVVTPLILLSL